MNIKGQKVQQQFGTLNPGHVFSSLGGMVYLKMSEFNLTDEPGKLNAIALDHNSDARFDSDTMIYYHAKATVLLEGDDK